MSAMSRLVGGFFLAAGLLGMAHPASAGNSVTRWAELAMQTVRDRNIGTPNAGRLYAMVTAAMYDAVNGIDATRHHGREPAIVPPAGAPIHGNRNAAVAAAAHAVLRGLAPDQGPALDAALAADLAELGETRRPVVAGRDWGAFVGQQVLVARAMDGTESADMISWMAVAAERGTSIGVHRADFDARFRHMTPFGIASKDPYRSDPPPALSSAEYTEAFNDVATFGRQDGDAERNEIALFWLAEGGTVRETGTWLQAVVAIVERQGTVRNLSKTARLFAQVGMAIADAVMVVWHTKAEYFTWRPFFAIREADQDGNPDTIADPSWTPRNVSIGASPEYNSGTSAFAGAASAVIERFYCHVHLAFCFETDLAPNGARCYASALEGAEEAGRSRIYQGIHFHFANEDGRRVGRAIGQEIAETRLRHLGPGGRHDPCSLP